MKLSKNTVISLALLVGLPVSAANIDTLRVSREKCIEIALSSSPTIKIADLEIKKTDYSKRETLANLFPSIDFSAAYQRAIELQTLSMNMGGQINNIKMGMDNVINLGFSAQMPIVNASLWKSIKLSDQQILATVEAARASKLDLVNNINKTYYAVLLAIASRDVIKANYDLAKVNADIFAKQYENGTASEYDVLRSSVQVKNIEPELLQADISIKQCLLQLKVLMGIDSALEIWPDITLKSMQNNMFGVSANTDRSIAKNSNLRTIEIQTETLKQTIDLKKYAYLPTLGLQYNLNWNQMSNGSPFSSNKFNPYSTISLALSIPICSGGSRYYGIKQSEVQYKEIQLQRENLIDQLQMQVDLAIDNINKEVKQIESCEESVRQAKKANEIMQKSFEIGAASYLNLRDSELASTQAQLAHLQAIYNYLVSTSELENLLGRDENIPQYKN